MPSPQDNAGRPLPWLEGLEDLTAAYPVLSGFLEGMLKKNPIARDIVHQEYMRQHNRPPGRCVLLTFNEDAVAEKRFETHEDLEAYLAAHPKGDPNVRRLWVLEDLQLGWVEVLGSALEVDPRVFAEQTNTFNFLDSHTIQSRLIPSMIQPAKCFTLRYFEFREMVDQQHIMPFTNQMTFAMNARRIERWRDIDTSSFTNKWQHLLIRRCASFWSNQRPGSAGWDAVILVDPPYDAFRSEKPVAAGKKQPCSILKGVRRHDGFNKLWEDRSWQEAGSVVAGSDNSIPYHGGAHTLARTVLSREEVGRDSPLLNSGRNLTSLLDEIALHWTTIRDPELLLAARAHSVNAAHYLLKSVATSWMNHLDLVEACIAASEYFADDNQAGINVFTSGKEWRRQLAEVAKRMPDMHSLRRQMYHFEAHLRINLERLGVFGDGDRLSSIPSPPQLQPQVIREAQQDFLYLQERLKPSVQRAATLRDSANEMASLHASFKSVGDSELQLTLAILASIVFPATLVASVFSMGGSFLPGEDQFWVYWVVTIPLTIVVAVGVNHGRRTFTAASRIPRGSLDFFKESIKRRIDLKKEAGKKGILP